MIELIQTLEIPINGYWDGGKKKTFHWQIDGKPKQDDKGWYVRVGSWAANHWFHVAMGRTDKQTLANARRKLTAGMKRNGISCTFAYEER